MLRISASFKMKGDGFGGFCLGLGRERGGGYMVIKYGNSFFGWVGN